MPEQKKNNPNRTFKLRAPIVDVEGNQITELELRKPKAKDLRVFDNVKGEIAGTYELISQLSGSITAKQVDEMELEDIADIIDWVSDFLPAGLGAAKAG